MSELLTPKTKQSWMTISYGYSHLGHISLWNHSGDGLVGAIFKAVKF